MEELICSLDSFWELCTHLRVGTLIIEHVHLCSVDTILLKVHWWLWSFHREFPITYNLGNIFYIAYILI